MNLLLCLVIGVLIGLLLDCAATPPVERCTICRFVNAQGEVWFRECDVPVGTPLDGWEVSWPRCSYRQQES